MKGMDTMNDLLNFWNHIQDTWGIEAIKTAAEDFNFDISKLNKDYLEKLSPKKINDLFCDVINFIMDGFGIDDYDNIYEMLIGAGISEGRARKIHQKVMY